MTHGVPHVLCIICAKKIVVFHDLTSGYLPTGGHQNGKRGKRFNPLAPSDLEFFGL
jgi:hypothetical protein